MARTNGQLNSFFSGEISPKLRRRTDLEGFYSSTEFQKNFCSTPQGEVFFREGTEGMSIVPFGQTFARLVPFIYDSNDSNILEFSTGPSGDIMRVFVPNSASVGCVSTENKQILGVEKRTDQLVLHINTASPALWAAGKTINIIGLTTTGYTQYNYYSFFINARNVSAFPGATHELVISRGGLVTSAAEAANTTALVYAEYSITHPFSTTALKELQWVQRQSVMWITSGGEEQVQELVRSGVSSWTLGNWTAPTDGAAAPVSLFTGATQRPRSIAFHEGRLWLGGFNEFSFDPEGDGSPVTVDAQDMLIGSAVGDFNLFDYNASSKTESTGVILFLGDSNDDICSLVSTRNYLYVQTIGGGFGVDGGDIGIPITHDNYVGRKLHNVGGREDLPAQLIDDKVYFVERSRRKLRVVDYDFGSDKFIPTDVTRNIEHLCEPLIERFAFARGVTDRIYIATRNSEGVAASYDLESGIVAGHRYAPGDPEGIRSRAFTKFPGLSTERLPKLVDAASVPSPDFGNDIVYLLVKRGVYFYTERRAIYATPLTRDELFTGDEALDERVYEGDLKETQMRTIHLDDYRTINAAQGAELTFANGGAVGSTTVTSDINLFSASHVGRRILGIRSDRYSFNDNLDGAPFGIATITAYTSATQVTVEVTEAFEYSPLQAGSYYFEFNGFNLYVYPWLSSLDQTVAVIIDGADMGDYNVPDTGILSFPDATGSIIAFGIRYKGILKTVNLQGASGVGSSDGFLKNIHSATLKFRDTKSCKVGTNLYNMEEIVFSTDNDNLNSPTPYNSNEVEVFFNENWTTEKNVYVLKDDHGPCIIQAISTIMNTSGD